jgi:hypothetical protein
MGREQQQGEAVCVAFSVVGGLAKQKGGMSRLAHMCYGS